MGCRFVQKLRHRAAAHKTVCMREGVATKLITASGGDYDECTDDVVAGVMYKSRDGAMRKAFGHLTVACDGMYSMLRKRLHEDPSSVRCLPPSSCSTAQEKHRSILPGKFY